MFRDWYNETPLQSVAYRMVHYGSNEDNAYWTGSKMLFGDGGSGTYPLVALDVICHELGHGFTQRYSDLIYKEQSGGINEAFSDMAGEAYYKKTDWMSGYTLMKAENEAFRYFFDPPKDGVSIKLANDFRAGMGVHYSSGVYNFVFYHVVEKGKIPIRYAFEGFLLANKIYWKENTDFNAGSCGSVRGAYHAGLDTEKYVDAFKAVGIVPCSLDKYLEMLVPAAPRSKVRVSNIRQPVFGVKTSAATVGLLVEAFSASGTPIKVAISQTMSRLNPLKLGTGQAEHSVSGSTLYYVRIYSESSAEINDVTVRALFG